MRELVHRARRGERAAVEELLHELLPEVRRKVRRYVGSGPDLDDVTQKVLIELARSLPRFRGDAKVTTWMHRICVRVAFRHLRARRQVLPFDPDCQLGDAGSGARRLEARDALRALDEVLADLSPERRMVFVLQEVEGHTAPEVAEMLEIPLGTVYGRLRDARRIVRRRLAERCALSREAG